MADIPYILQCNKRGQIVIPKDIRDKLGIKAADFEIFPIDDRNMFLKVKNKKS